MTTTPRELPELPKFWRERANGNVSGQQHATLRRCAAELEDAIALSAAESQRVAGGELATMKSRKDAAYFERNQVVAALANCYPSGIKPTAIEGWSDDWHGCVYVDLPTGQASWHYHDSHAHMFAHLPPYKGEWDGHSTDEKYARIAALNKHPPGATPAPRVDGEDCPNCFGSQVRDGRCAKCGAYGIASTKLSTHSEPREVTDGDSESLDSQVARLAKFIMDEIEGEPSQSQGAIDTAICLLKIAYAHPQPFAPVDDGDWVTGPMLREAVKTWKRHSRIYPNATVDSSLYEAIKAAFATRRAGEK